MAAGDNYTTMVGFTTGWDLQHGWIYNMVGFTVNSGRNRVKLFFWGGGPYPGADTVFPGGGVKTFTSTPPPRTLSA